MVGNSEVLEDDYGIAVIPEHFIDIVTGVDPSKFAGGSGRIGEEVLRRGFGFGVVDKNAKGKTTTKRKNNDVSSTD
jgi:ribosomal protein S19E (S16A)